MRITYTAATAIVGAFALMPLSGPLVLAQDATPAPMASCEDAASSTAMGTPGAKMGDMDMGTPMAGMDPMAMELDQMYIDMMIPHHASIIAMAQAALPRLEDPRLQAMAEAIIAAQGPEIEELRGYRETLYGGAEPMPMDENMMAAMDQMMPGMTSSMEEMAFQMDATAQVAAVCAADDADLAFIDLTIPHHQMAIEASEAVLDQATHPEIQDFAQKVIDAQQREIDELTAIRGELTGAATPASP